MAAQTPTHITLVVYRDPDEYEGDSAVVASYYDPARAEARAAELDRPIWEAVVVDQDREFARAREQVAAYPLSAEDAAYFEVLARTRGGTRSSRRAAREAVEGMPKPAHWGDNDPRAWLAFFEARHAAVADFAVWRAKAAHHYTLTCPVEDAPRAPAPR